MDDSGAQNQAVTEAEASDHKPKTIRGCQQKQKQEQSTYDESQNQQDNEAEASNTRKRGRKPTLTPDQRRAKKIQRDRDYQTGKNEERKEFKERIEALEKEKKENQSELSEEGAFKGERPILFLSVSSVCVFSNFCFVLCKLKMNA
ncbi:hypothetical protein PTKIN_Ptkin12aG0015500 [Pterospermum kingtungense]